MCETVTVQYVCYTFTLCVYAQQGYAFGRVGLYVYVCICGQKLPV